MKKLLLLLLVPNAAFGLSAEEIGILLNGRPTTLGQPLMSPQTDIIIKESYIKNGSIFGSAPPPPMGLNQETGQAMQQGLRRAEIQWAEKEAAESRYYQWNK